LKVDFQLPKPLVVPPLDEGFRPAVLANRRFKEEVAASGRGEPLLIGLERPDGSLSRYETQVFPEDDDRAATNMMYTERLFKFLLWQYGGNKVYIGGPSSIADYIRGLYCAEGKRRFDHRFMGRVIYDRPFAIVSCQSEEVPPANEIPQALGGHLEGCRVGFDLGASDRKAAAVVDGEEVFHEEVEWEPASQADPRYHYDQIMGSIKRAAAKMPRLDAVGGSAAGVYINNRVRVASIFRGVPWKRYAEVRNMFLRMQRELGVPLVVLNDGEVTALAGAMSLEASAVMGIALGSSEASGYVSSSGAITGWLNELAFNPIDYSPSAPCEGWSRDVGVGALYLSQQAVFRLAPLVDICIPKELGNAKKLEYVQEYLEKEHHGAEKIWQTIGCYLGYAIAHYTDFYTIDHVLILGRCTSGRGGAIILEWANRVLKAQFLSLNERLQIQLPDEKSRRIGQSIAAASLPRIDRQAS
jgi:predicted NBD/HSP70 family sugar kinase